MRIIKIFSIALLAACSLNSFAQVDPVIMTVNGKSISKGEFEAIFKKNNKEEKITQASLDEYMNLFVNFKLKVTDAEVLGLDTVQKFKDELNGYRKQLSRPYLVDNELTEELVKEAYERLKWEVRASHILVKCDWEAEPKDSLRAYKRAMDLRNRIIKGAEFEKVAMMKDGSEDPSVQKNKGDIGWFTAFQMVYRFECAAYTMNLNEVSMPIRTRYGYHIIKLTGKRQARGTIRVAHILVSAKSEEPAETIDKARKKAEELLGRLRKGEDFAVLASQFSDDNTTSKKGGELPEFGTGKMVEEFEAAAFGLQKDGDISEIVQTAYGFHILKRLELKGLQPYDAVKAKLKQQVQRDTRSHLPKKSFIDKLKKKYNFKEFPSTLTPYYTVIDTNVFYGSWDHKKASGLNATMFSFAGENFTQTGFTEYIFKSQRRVQTEVISAFVNAAYQRWVNDVITNYEDARLEENYPEFKLLMKEYRDGILLFELTDQKVWSKAVKDTAGLKLYYEQNIQKYMWPKRYDVDVFYCANPAIAKQLRKDLKANKLDQKALLEKYNKESQLNLKVVSGKLTPDDNDIIKKYTPTAAGINKKDFVENDQYVILRTNKILEPMPKTIAEAKGIITSDYQNALEKEWLDDLKKKYPVTINKEVLYSIK